mmetsp:Transcript_58329/g.126692  ORF Transcript_58329/g.126692 Transcript_58329/m.126692 type:complete len:100 (-) Transcript_58329:79-378(-)
MAGLAVLLCFSSMRREAFDADIDILQRKIRLQSVAGLFCVSVTCDESAQHVLTKDALDFDCSLNLRQRRVNLDPHPDWPTRLQEVNDLGFDDAACTESF